MRRRRTLSAALDARRHGGSSSRRKALEDLAWAILTGREFLFTH